MFRKVKELMNGLEDLGYFTRNLWHIEDVKTECPDGIEVNNEEALDILQRVLTSPPIMGMVFNLISEEVDSYINENYSNE